MVNEKNKHEAKETEEAASKRAGAKYCGEYPPDHPVYQSEASVIIFNKQDGNEEKEKEAQ